jgi:methionyl-tRNA formyltransferase
MQMEAGLDTGPMLATEEVPIDRKTAGQVTNELAEIGARLIIEVLPDLDSRPHFPQPDEGVTYAAKIAKDEARIDWSRTAVEIDRQVRAFAPVPGAWFEVDGERIKLLEAEIGDGRGNPGEVLDDSLTVAVGDGVIRPIVVQRAGRAPMFAGELLRGYAIAKGTILP